MLIYFHLFLCAHPSLFVGVKSLQTVIEWGGEVVLSKNYLLNCFLIYPTFLPPFYPTDIYRDKDMVNYSFRNYFYCRHLTTPTILNKLAGELLGFRGLNTLEAL